MTKQSTCQQATLLRQAFLVFGDCFTPFAMTNFIVMTNFIGMTNYFAITKFCKN